MRHVAVAVPACLSLIFFGQHEVDAPGFHELLVELRMAADAIVHDYLGAGIFCHEEVLTGDVLMGNMAIVACSIARMARMKPCGIIGRHDMTVDACRRVIAQIAMSSQDVQKE